MLYYIILYYIILYYIILYYIISYHIISYYIILYHIISYYIILYHIISYHIILYHITSHHMILYYMNRFLFVRTIKKPLHNEKTFQVPGVQGWLRSCARHQNEPNSRFPKGCHAFGTISGPSQPGRTPSSAEQLG